MIVPDTESSNSTFAEPWEARIFCLIVALNAQGLFEWKAFQSLLAEEIRHGEAIGAGRTYYADWLAAAERLLEKLSLCTRDEVEAVVDALRPDDRTVRHR
jgi:nitrile hydratase accessory protein